jgi:hypothetical protein
MIIAFQAEKISGSLLLIPNLGKLCYLYQEIKSIIEEIECINREFFPILNNAINTLAHSISSLSNILVSTNKEFSSFKSNNYKSFRDYDIFKAQNSENINVFQDYISLYPEFEAIYKKRNKYLEEIEELTTKHKRLLKFKTQLSRCAQLICDYGLASCDNYLSTDMNRAQELLSVSDGTFVTSKDQKRLFKYKNTQHSKIVLLLDTIKVVCGNALSNNCSIETIKFPVMLKKIGDCCFQCCYNLREVILPNSLEEMGTDNFYACRSLKRVVLSSSMKEIPSWSFQNCCSLNQIIIPPSIKKIGSGAFRGCSSLISINLPTSIEEVGDDVFKECINLKKIFVSKSSIFKFEKLLWQYKNKLIGVDR